MGSDDERPTPPDVGGVETTYGRTSAFRPARREPLLVADVPVSGEVPRYRGSARRPRPPRRADGCGARAALGDGVRPAGRSLAGQRPLHAAAADGRVRAARLVAQARHRPGGRDLDARRRGRASARRRGQRRRGRAGVDARAARRRLLPARASAAARLDRRLLLASGADRLPARRRGHARDRASSASCSGSTIDATRAARAALGGRPRARRRERHHARRQRRLARRACSACAASSRSCPVRSSSSSAAIGALLGARPREPTASRSSARSRAACRARRCRHRRSATSSQLVPAAVGLFLVSFADEILTARAFAGQAPRDRARVAGAADDGRGERGRRLHAGRSRSVRAVRAPR